jgi:protein TonB
VTSSGFAALDEETLALVQRAQPFPEPPPGVLGDEIKFMVPVRFAIR